MSVEEEIELRDLVAQTLETNGCLAKIRAQLRASIFLALDEDMKINNQQPLLNNKVKTFLETEEGKVMFCVVREFLEFFNLCITLSVFDPESYIGNHYNYESRERTAKDLGLDNTNDTTVPLLLQLIKIAQNKTKRLDINLDMNKDEREEKSVTQDNSISTLNKTDSNNVFVDQPNIHSLNNSKLLIESYATTTDKLNATFDVSSPTINFNSAKKTENNIPPPETSHGCKDHVDESTSDIKYKKEEKEEDTYDDTSSIAEDSVGQVKLENSVSVSELIVNGVGENINECVSDPEVSQPILKETKLLDKSKLSPQKPEKLKTKNSLSTLSDLPPLQMNKSRVNDILPSLYSKEFKEKSNLRELDKLFDMEAEYEEDFSGDDLSLKSDYTKSGHSKSNIFEDLQHPNKSSSSDKSVCTKRDLKSNRIISDCNKQIFKSLVNNSKSKDTKNIDITNKNENGSSSSSINDILGSNNSV